MKSLQRFLALTKKGVVFIELPLILTIFLDLSAWRSKLAHFRAFVHRWRSVLAPDTEEDNRFKSSMKALTKSSGLLLITNLRIKSLSMKKTKIQTFNSWFSIMIFFDLDFLLIPSLFCAEVLKLNKKNGEHFNNHYY